MGASHSRYMQPGGGICRIFQGGVYYNDRKLGFD